MSGHRKIVVSVTIFGWDVSYMDISYQVLSHLTVTNLRQRSPSLELLKLPMM